MFLVVLLVHLLLVLVVVVLDNLLHLVVLVLMHAVHLVLVVVEVVVCTVGVVAMVVVLLVVELVVLVVLMALCLIVEVVLGGRIVDVAVLVPVSTSSTWTAPLSNKRLLFIISIYQCSFVSLYCWGTFLLLLINLFLPFQVLGKGSWSVRLRQQ